MKGESLHSFFWCLHNIPVSYGWWLHVAECCYFLLGFSCDFGAATIDIETRSNSLTRTRPPCCSFGPGQEIRNRKSKSLGCKACSTLLHTRTVPPAMCSSFNNAARRETWSPYVSVGSCSKLETWSARRACVGAFSTCIDLQHSFTMFEQFTYYCIAKPMACHAVRQPGFATPLGLQDWTHSLRNPVMTWNMKIS